ncbi:response regulator [Paenibacillus sp.]|uniref:response regulator n=1 Tax=Paenibacillus sp. TaxID=58172 RepID=UPI002D4D0E92|nr:response regulator [Paenibacillus sp.]HZG57040.1 response regulator [Paenibacillus sp.]
MYTVVTIDDEPLVKKTLRVLIERYPEELYQVVGEAEDGKEGLELIESLAPDLVITDLNMPVMGGLELIERLRAAARDVEVAVLSGYDDFDFAQQALRFGVVDYILKPIRPESVRQLLDRFHAKRSADAAASSGRGAWISFCSETAKALAERVWLLDVPGADEALDRFAGGAAARGLRGEVEAEAYQALATLIGSELSQRGAGGLEPLPVELESGAETPLPSSMRDEVRRRLKAKIAELQDARQVGNHQGIRAAVAYLDARFHDPAVSLPLVAGVAGMSQAHFSRTFKKEMGVSFVEYVTRQRIERAKALLDAPGTKSWEIAESVGYQEYAHFAKVFRKYTGLTPTEYRRRETGDGGASQGRNQR